MDAQDQTATTATRRNHEGYGTVSSGQPMVNGVGEGVRQGDVRSEQFGVQENPNLHDPAPSASAQAPQRSMPETIQEVMGEREPPYAQGGLDFRTVATRTPTTTTNVPVVLQEGLSAPPRNSAIRSQEYFSAESQPSAGSPQPQQAMRWMTRVTEFLRTTATRGAVGMDRMLDNLGFQHVQVTGPFGNSAATQETVSMSLRATNISPPEDLPPRATPPKAPPMPLSWSMGRQQEAPLFDQDPMERMRQAQREHPLLLGQPSEEGSEHSSRLQAEVQRQMEEYANRYREEVQRLQSTTGGPNVEA